MKKLWSEIRYWIFILIFLAILFELVASMILFRKYTPSKSATLYFISKAFNKTEEQQYKYEPWLMFRLDDHHSDRVNVRSFERRSVPDVYVANNSSDTIDIFFFGGNAMFGQHLADNETIPSRFLKAYAAGHPSKTIRVKNFGIPHYYSKQELMLLSSLIFQGKRPDMVVFLDGYNDFYPARMLYYDKPYFSYALQQSFEGKMFQKGNETFVDSTDEFFNDPVGVSATDYNNALIAKYMNNIRMTAALCEATGVKSFFFCQPVPYYKSPQSSQQQYKGNFKRFDYIYPELERNKDSIADFYFLGNMNEGDKDKNYSDEQNYTPAFADKIARQILNNVKKDLQ